jgi:hypothetical protein
LVRQVAAQYLAAQGPAAIAYLRDQAALAEANQDELSARAWDDIAEAAEAQLGNGLV